MSHALATKKQPAPAKAAPATRASPESSIDTGEPAGLPQFLQPGGQANVQRAAPSAKKKAFSRVLKEGMQTWMKKTTYLSNDYSRKVHDFSTRNSSSGQ